MNVVKLSVLLLFGFSLSLQAQPKCTIASLNGNLFYTISGSIKSGNTTVSYAELGQVTADGNGGLSGQTTSSTAGVIATLPVTGSYVIRQDCSGTVTLTTTVQSLTVAIQVVNGGGLTLGSITTSVLGELSQVRFYRAANATGSQCGNGSLSGSHGLLLSGGTYSGGVRTPYEVATQLTFDGNGGITAVAGEVTTDSTNGQVGFNGTGTYTIAANCSGTAQFKLTNTTQLNYLIARVEGGTVLFLENDATTTITGSSLPQLLQSILPQFVYGAGWYSALYFTNATASAVTFQVVFTSDSGTPLVVPGVGSAKQVTIAPNNTAIIEAQNAGTFAEGYATFALPAGVTGYGVFRQSVTGRADQEALVGFKSATETATSLIWDDTNFTTSVAIVNNSSVATIVTITVWDSSGNLVGTSLQAVGAGSKIANQMRSFTGLAGMAGLRGRALFSVSTGNVAVLGLRFSGQALTSVPTVQEQ